MQYGAMNHPVKPLPAEIAEIGELGFDYLELTMDAPQAHYAQVRQQRNTIRQALRRHGLDLVCHLPTFVYTADLTPSIRQASLDEVLRSLETAADLSARKIVLHPSIISGLGSLVKKTAVAHALESLDRILRRAAELGQCICLENMFPRLDYMVEPDEFAPLFAAYEELKFTLDVGHAFIGVHTPARILAFMHRFADRLQHIHISDNHGRRDDHLPVGRGDIPYADLIRALQDRNYDGTMTLEIFTDDRRDLVASREIIEGLLL